MNIKNVIFAALIIILSSCTSQQKNNKKETKEITIAYVDGWAEGVAMTYVSKAILEDKGYTVKLVQAGIDMVYASLASGDVDVYMDAWLPMHTKKVAKMGNKIEGLGVNFDKAKIGLVVPAYVDINSIEELNDVVDKFEGKIFGIEKGSGTAAKTEQLIKDYNLNYEQLNSSSIAMFTQLKKAINKKEWVLITGWAPHWKFGRYDLKFLDDPKGSYGNNETVETYARKGFKEDDKFAAAYFANFRLTEEQISDLMVKMKDGKGEKEATAKSWIAQNQELVQSWLKINE